jgi:putative ATP-dependent endonuclease of the OLD family
MRLSKLSIRNFRNFRSVDIPVSGNVVLLGENRVGKSNILFAVRLILDPTLPDPARQRTIGPRDCQPLPLLPS